MKVNIKYSSKDASIPKKKISSDFCYDVFAISIKDLGDGRIEYGFNIALQKDHSELKEGYRYSFKLLPRSSIHETGLILSNCEGVIDQGFTGDMKAVFYNIIPTLPNYEIGDRIAQIYVAITKDLEFTEVEELVKTERGENGYGHTGNK